MSPSRTPARAAAPSTCSTRTPDFSVKSLRCASGRSATGRPSPAALAGLVSASLARLLFSASNSPTVMANSLGDPRRKTCTVALLPGLIFPMKRGRSADFSTVVPSTLVMMSPASTPALSAGLPGSTCLTKAPDGLPRPMASATSLLTASITTPMRPRVTFPLARS